MNWKALRTTRRIVQWVALAIYVYLLFASLQTRAAFPLADAFFRLNPLVGLTSMVAGRTFIPRLLPALAIVLLTLLLGRVWCGWLCPLGTILDSIRPRRRPARGSAQRWARGHDVPLRRAKYVLLLVVLAAAALGSLTLLVLDPITILTRTMTTAVLPAINRSITGLAAGLYRFEMLRGPVSAFEQLVRGRILPVSLSAFTGAALIGLAFVAIVALNWLADRFWCRYLCPLGALLGLLSRVSVFRRRISANCNACGTCASACPVETVSVQEGYEADPAECLVCLDCFVACPQEGIEFRAHASPAPSRAYDPSRRQFLASVGGAALGVAILGSDAASAIPQPRLIRPPGAWDERRFQSLCVRCSQCMKVCPTAGLQPCIEEAGLRGFGTPRLVPRMGYCDYSCNACGQVCPSGAIPPLDLEDKRLEVIGVADIDVGRCLPWAYGTPCIVCEEMCPLPEKAVWLTEESVPLQGGSQVMLQLPHVNRDLCIGCGICEYQCPLEGESAIRVQRI